MRPWVVESEPSSATSEIDILARETYALAMDQEGVRQRRDAIIAEHGRWTAHNIHLGGDVFTFENTDQRFDKQIDVHGQHLRRIVQIVADLVGKPLESLRIADLGCLEGLYAIEFCRRGAEAVGIDGREANLAKARFAKETLGLDRLRLERDDVRNLSVEKYGEFDVVLCLGLLYHLDAPDVFRVVERMAAVCTGITIIDTHVAIRSAETRQYKGKTYAGFLFREHERDTNASERLRSLWASLDNERSFWLTRPSLYNILTESGFTSAYSCYTPAFPEQWEDRDTIVAIKGSRQPLLSTPRVAERPPVFWPESSVAGLFPAQKTTGRRVLSQVKTTVRNLMRRTS